MIRVFCALLAIVAAPAASAQDQSWDAELIDPAGGADVILPLPCGGGMAFQRIGVPVDPANPIDDRPLRIGQSEEATGYSDYLTPVHLRGAFDDDAALGSYYLMARYEMNRAQYRALTGDCGSPFTRQDRFAAGGLSWFDAVDLTRVMTEWILAHAADAMPGDGARVGFIRLPTEVEWEYAARGGAAIDPTLFPARRYFDTGELGDHAHYQAAGKGRGKLRPVGLRLPNPLGLYDIYGNVEELMLEPFRLNAIGRRHGQVGGIVTRGGAVDTTAENIYSAQRREYPTFNPRTGTALKSDFFGLRPVISAQIVSDARFEGIKQGWEAQISADTDADTDTPLVTLDLLLSEELDPRRKQALTDLQLEFRVARDAADTSIRQAASSTLLSGGSFVESLIELERQIRQLKSRAKSLRDQISNATASQREQLMPGFQNVLARIERLRDRQNSYLLPYRAALETLISDVPPASRDAAYQTLTQALTEAGQKRLLNLLRLFWRDADAYGQEPDMSAAGLLRLAITD